MISNLSLGFSIALDFTNVLYCFIGVLLGTAIGVLPGLGPLATMSILLPLTVGLEPVTSLIMLAGIYYGSQYGGSTTAILINLPGEAASAVTTLDGYSMAQQGRGGQALAAAALGSFFAGTVATLLIAVVATPLTAIAIRFGPADYFSLMTLGLVSSVALASGSVIKAIGMIVLGLLLGLTGTDIYTGAYRFTFGEWHLIDGIDLIALSVGMFGVVEIFRNMEGSRPRVANTRNIGSIFPTREDLLRIVGPMMRGTTIGSLLGVLPGGGALLSSFVAYNFEKNISKTPEKFGKGAIEGVAAPESANNAGAQTAFIPMLSLGIPSNVVMALMLGAMIMQGITPGPDVVTKNPELFWGLIVSMWIGNAMLVVLNLPLVGIWVALFRIPYSILFPAIIIFCCIGVYSVNNDPFYVYLVTISSLLGYLLVKLECEIAPFILGFILGPLLEEHLRRAMLLSGGDLSVLVTRPISAVLLTLTVVTLVLLALPTIRKKRQQVFVDDEQ